MTNIFSNIEESEIIIKEGLLEYSWEPEKIYHRESEIIEIVSSIRPLLFKKKPQNLLIHGKPGIGKTLTLKKVLKDLKTHTSDVKTVFVNCWDNNREYQIMGEISKQLGYFFYQGKGKQEIFNEITRRIKKHKGIVFVFDEADKAKEYGFLYSILDNLPENSSNILITNDKEFTYDLEPRILSRINLIDLEFKPYNKEQVKQILLQRAELALKPNSLNEAELLRIVNKTIEAEDIRVGLFLLHNSAKNAEQDMEQKIKSSHVTSAINNLYQFRIKTSLSKLGENERLITNIVLQKPGLTSGELYTYYQNEGGKLSDRSYRRALNKLERLELIDMSTSGTGMKGKTRIITPGPKMKHTQI